MFVVLYWVAHCTRSSGTSSTVAAYFRFFGPDLGLPSLLWKGELFSVSSNSSVLIVAVCPSSVYPWDSKNSRKRVSGSPRGDLDSGLRSLRECEEGGVGNADWLDGLDGVFAAGTGSGSERATAETRMLHNLAALSSTSNGLSRSSCRRRM